MIKYLFCTVILGCLVACGQAKSNPESNLSGSDNPGLRIVLQTPQGSDSELFWHSVSERSFFWKAPDSSEAVRIEASEITNFSFSEHSSGLLRFEGRNNDGELLVEGECNVEEEATQAIIALHRRYD